MVDHFGRIGLAASKLVNHTNHTKLGIGFVVKLAVDMVIGIIEEALPSAASLGILVIIPALVATAFEVAAFVVVVLALVVAVVALVVAVVARGIAVTTVLGISLALAFH